ncbi:MAG TPA: NUDIX domain-containing protein [Candidatus Ozemobacteraceae bacterium]|nr:NUDIX domain-containing protein [Candidatus Ozemobacteraceae bacterium]
MKTQRLRISAYALINDQERILLCRISKELPEWEGVWTLPGGGLEFGESPDASVVREVEEETGLIIRPDRVAGIDNLLVSRDHEDFQGIRIIYNATVTGGELRHETSGTTDRCEWHRFDQLSQLKMVELVEAGVNMIRSNARYE